MIFSTFLFPCYLTVSFRRTQLLLEKELVSVPQAVSKTSLSFLAGPKRSK